MKLKTITIILTMLLASAALASAASAKPKPLYWGATIGDQITGEQAPWDMQPVQQFQQAVGKSLSLIAFNSSFSECTGSKCEFIHFPRLPLENVRTYGAIPMFNWSTNSTPFREVDPNYRLSAIISGRYDDYIRYFAQEAKAWGHPFFLRLDWEMNGYWFPWSDTANGNRRGEFVRMWRHVHDIFTEVGANNVSWVWCPNVNIGGELQPLKQVYPGDRYVDWTGLDGFNWGIRHGSPGWLSFHQVFRKTYRQVVRLAPSKPMVIAETASTEKGGSRPAWIRNALNVVPSQYPKVRGLMWFDVNDRGTNWPIERSPKSKRAFRAGISRGVYRPNAYAGLSPGKILPPR